MDRKLLYVLILGLILRVIIAAFTYHPDVRIVNYTSAIYLKEFNLNPYDFVNQLGEGDTRKNIYVSEIPDDLPLQYVIRLPLEVFTRFITNPQIENQFLTDASKLFGNPAFYLHLITIKLPLILFDISLGLLLTYFIGATQKKKILLFWMINPISLWATAAVGQVDILPTFFLVLSVLLLSKQKKGWAAFTLGVGGALKSFPFLLAPFLILTAQTWKERIKLGLILLIPLLISVFPYIFSPSFRQNALFAPQLDKVLYAKINISGGESIIINLAILFFLYFYYLSKKRGPKDFLNFAAGTLLLIFSFTHFHIQWFLWVTPFLILYLIRGVEFYRKLAVLLMFISIIGMLFLFESSLQFGIFAPIFPFLDKTPGFLEMMGRDQSVIFRDIFASLFAATAIIFSLPLFLKSEE